MTSLILNEKMRENKFQGQYVIITPVKNEERSLPDLIQSVVNQTVKPVLWVIVDDGSTDHTPEIIKEAKEKHEWIQSIRLKGSVRDRGIHLASVIRKGIEFAYEYCEKMGIKFEYLGNIDADVVLENTYFEHLLKKFESNPKLGIASGELWLKEGDKAFRLELRYPDGGDILYRRECFENCGGIPLTVWNDSVLNAKAKLRGWEVRRFNDSKAYVIRRHCHAGRLWHEYIKEGKSSYILNYNLIYAILKGFKLSFKRPYYIGFAYLYGYLSSLILREEQINDEEIKYYYKFIRPREINCYYINMLKNKFKIKRRR